jgi:archaellum component FlaG (FlaF/FlaG flagellin family)
MAFGDLAVHMIIFIAVISLATGLTIVMKNQVDHTTGSLILQQKRIADTLKTDITIEVVSHDSVSHYTYVYLKNTGETKIDIAKTDIYSNNIWIPRNIINRTIEVLPDSDTINVGTWDPGEEILIRISQTLSSSISHSIKVSTDNSVSDEKDFSF